MGRLSKEQSDKVSTLLTIFQLVFSKVQGDLGYASRVKHEIDTGDAAPLNQAPRRVSVAQGGSVYDCRRDGATGHYQTFYKSLEFRTEERWDRSVLQRLLPAQQRHPQGFVSVTKYRKDLRRFLARWFSTLDLKCGYWQVELDSDPREKTAFCKRTEVLEGSSTAMHEWSR